MMTDFENTNNKLAAEQVWNMFQHLEVVGFTRAEALQIMLGSMAQMAAPKKPTYR